MEKRDGLLTSLASDLKRYQIEMRKDCKNYLHYLGQFILVVLTCEGFWAVALYRLGSLFVILRLPLVAYILSKLSRFLTGNYIHYKVQIGQGFKISHTCNVIVARRIGSFVHVTTNVTIGQPFEKRGFSVSIGDNVYIGAGARIFSSVGSNVIIGANAVVNRPVADDCVVAGVPARVIRRLNIEDRTNQTKSARTEGDKQYEDLLFG